MKSIGMLNSHFYNNYGCVLVAYALQETINRKYGYIAESISYDLDRILHDKSLISFLLSYEKYYGFKNTVGKIAKRIFKGKTYQNEHISDIKKTKFNDFRINYLNISKPYAELTVDNSPDYDVYCVGSDVVWGLHKIFVQNTPMFLDFTVNKSACRRISYSASLAENPFDFGKRKSVKDLYRRGLAKFDMVSVREAMSAKYLSDLYPGKVYNCIDPTLLLDADDYSELMKRYDFDNSEDEYLYTYLLSNGGSLANIKNPKSIASILNKASNIYDLPIIGCCSQNIKKFVGDRIQIAEDDGPIDFLYRIMNSKVVITNSFHACVFSIIFRKNFWIVSRGKQDFKIQSLLDRLSLSERIIKSDDINVNFKKPIDYSLVEEKLEEWKQESFDYLDMALNGKDLQ